MGLARRIDKVQLKIMEALKDCHLDRIGAMNALLSITLSIATEEAPDDPIKAIHESLSEIQDWQNYFLYLAK